MRITCTILCLSVFWISQIGALEFKQAQSEFQRVTPTVPTMAIVVDISDQQLYVLKHAKSIQNYPVSTSKYGIGSQAGSNKTPLGLHLVEKKIGDQVPKFGILKARRYTNKLATIVKDPIDVPEDHVTTRLMWLKGLEPGKNLGKGVDSYHRYIYIHGTHEEGLIGTPASHGCIRLKNNDILSLYHQMPLKSLVYIQK